MTTLRHRPARLTVCLIGALALASCTYLSSNPPEPDPLLPPQDHRKQIVATVQKVVGDPTGIRDAAITELAVRPVGNASLYTACVRFNPRKSATEYAGVQERLAIFHGGNLAQFIRASSGECANVAWQPFPELEQLCFGERCPRR